MSDNDRVEARFQFLLRAVALFIQRYSETHHVKLMLSHVALRNACLHYFEAAEARKRYTIAGTRLNQIAIGALTCHALARFRPIMVVEADGASTEDQHAIFTYANELMALSIGASIAEVNIAASMMVLIEMLSSGIDEMNFYRVFSLLDRKKDRP